jgi:hypothetical protein
MSKGHHVTLRTLPCLPVPALIPVMLSRLRCIRLGWDVSVVRLPLRSYNDLHAVDFDPSEGPTSPASGGGVGGGGNTRPPAEQSSSDNTVIARSL